MSTWKRILMNDQVEHNSNVKTQNWGNGQSLASSGHFNGEVCKFGNAPPVTASGKIYAFVGGTWILADKDIVAHGKALLGVSTGSAASNSFPLHGFLIKGLIRMNDAPLGSPAIGDVLYVGDSGVTTATTPTGTGDIVRAIGSFIYLNNKTILFDPDKTWVELV